MTAVRTYLCTVLVLCLLLTSQTMAVARGAQGPSGQIVLCTGDGPVTMLVDAEGQPTGAVHVCPDCALGLFDAPSARLIEAVQPVIGADLVVSCHVSSATTRDVSGVRARGPPRAG